MNTPRIPSKRERNNLNPVPSLVRYSAPKPFCCKDSNVFSVGPTLGPTLASLTDSLHTTFGS
ncbi:hypothetical protein PROAA_20041 [Candidatus Propionivibrio aalborgensis]|uniref:Uncharacterized protein n=1 Tax=Candidatus Propionivibrio aalborgensis TaxID=1860101 RepID=A0A1A8XP05_9RHOO|nr:hypothetical protein PROAA_20041 [Candidatus Propionivibrio aalborgensis]